MSLVRRFALVAGAAFPTLANVLPQFCTEHPNTTWDETAYSAEDWMVHTLNGPDIVASIKDEWAQKVVKEVARKGFDIVRLDKNRLSGLDRELQLAIEKKGLKSGPLPDALEAYGKGRRIAFFPDEEQGVFNTTALKFLPEVRRIIDAVKEAQAPGQPPFRSTEFSRIFNPQPVGPQLLHDDRKQSEEQCMYLEVLLPLSTAGASLNVVPYSHRPALQQLCPWRKEVVDQHILWDKSWERFDPWQQGVHSIHIEFGFAMVFAGGFTHGGGSGGQGHPRMHVYLTNSVHHEIGALGVPCETYDAKTRVAKFEEIESQKISALEFAERLQSREDLGAKTKLDEL